jgi:hypothetical protein
MNWNDEFYERKMQRHLDEVKCWCFAVLIAIALFATAGVFYGLFCLGRWLTGGV